MAGLGRTDPTVILGSLSSFTFNLSGPLPSGGNLIGSVEVSNFPATQPVSGAVAVTNLPVTQLVSGSVAVTNFPATQPVNGTVSVGNFPATQPVSGTFWQATQPVSGTVAVSNFPATQPVSGSISVSNFPATQPVSGTFWQATQPVSGTVTANAGTNLNTSALLLDATFTGRINTQGQKTSAASTPVVLASDQSAVPVSGTFWQATQPVSATALPLPAGAATSALQTTINTTLGSPMQQTGGSVSVTNFPATQPVSGSVSVSNFPATQPVSGSVSVSNLPATQPVSGTFFQATQPVSATALPLPANAAQETGGNLASMVTLLTCLQQLIDLNTKILAAVQAGNLQNASAFGVFVDPASVIPDPTFN